MKKPPDSIRPESLCLVPTNEKGKVSPVPGQPYAIRPQVNSENLSPLKGEALERRVEDYAEWRIKLSKERATELTCPYCAVKFPFDPKRPKKKYHSPECQQRDARLRRQLKGRDYETSKVAGEMITIETNPK